METEENQMISEETKKEDKQDHFSDEDPDDTFQVLCHRRLRDARGQLRHAALPRHHGAGACQHRPAAEHHRGQGEHRLAAEEAAITESACRTVVKTRI